jgi:predicted P-loop ATPase
VYHFDPGKENTRDAAVQLCLRHRFDPIVSYLATIKWDEKPRLETWLIDYLGAQDTPLIRAIGKIALVAAVRRARSPGCKFDPIILLEGVEGTEKSTSIEVLAGKDNFSDQSIFGMRDREPLAL